MKAERIPPVAPPSRPSPVRPVPIPAEGRNAIYALVKPDLGSFEELSNAAQAGDLEKCHRLGRGVADRLRLIVDGGLGWGDTATRGPVHLTLPPEELRRILAGVKDQAVLLLDAMAEEDAGRAEHSEIECARDTCAEILAALSA